MGRRATFTRGAQDLYRVIGNAGDRLARVAIEPVVAHDAADRRRGPAQKRAVADRRDRRKVLVVRVREHRAPREQPVQALLVLRPEAQQIVVAELIDRDGHDQLGLFGCGRGAPHHHKEKDNG